MTNKYENIKILVKRKAVWVPQKYHQKLKIYAAKKRITIEQLLIKILEENL